MNGLSRHSVGRETARKGAPRKGARFLGPALGLLAALWVRSTAGVQYEVFRVAASGEDLPALGGASATAGRFLGPPRVNNLGRTIWLTEFAEEVNGFRVEAVHAADVSEDGTVELLEPIAITQMQAVTTDYYIGFSELLSLNNLGVIAYHAFLSGGEAIFTAEPTSSNTYTNKLVVRELMDWPEGSLPLQYARFDAPDVNDLGWVVYSAEAIEIPPELPVTGIFFTNQVVMLSTDELPSGAIANRLGLPRVDLLRRVGLTVRSLERDVLVRVPHVEPGQPRVIEEMLGTGDEIATPRGRTAIENLSLFSGMARNGVQSAFATGDDTNIWMQAILTPPDRAIASARGPAPAGQTFFGFFENTEINSNTNVVYVGGAIGTNYTLGVFVNMEPVALDMRPTPDDPDVLFYDFTWASINDLGWVAFHTITTNTTMQGEAALGEAIYVAVPYPRPGMQFVKTVAGVPDGEIAFIPGGGHDIVYQYELVNTGELHLASIRITDDHGTPGDPDDDPEFEELFPAGTEPMAPGASTTLLWRVRVSDTLTNQAVMVANPVFADGQDYGGVLNVTNRDDAIVEITGLDLQVTAGDAPNGRTEFVVDGGPVEYRYRLTNVNTGDLVRVQVTDDVYGGQDDLLFAVPDIFTRGSRVETSFVAQVTQTVTNLATATGVPVNAAGTPIPDATVRDLDATIVYVGPAGLELTKWVDGLEPGEVEYILAPQDIRYNYRITNVGREMIGDLRLYDLAGSQLRQLSPLPWQGLLAPANTFVASFELPVTQTTRNLGIIVGNPVEANGADIPALIDVEDTDYAEVRLVHPLLALEKRAGIAEPGETAYVNAPGLVEFAYTVRNDGDIALGRIELVDDRGTADQADDDLVFTLPDLAPGQETDVAASYIVTATQTNVARVSGSPLDDAGVAIDDLPEVSAEAAAEVVAVRARIELRKGALGGELGEPGQFFLSSTNMSFVYEARNVGDTTLLGLRIVDDAATPRDDTDDLVVVEGVGPLFPDAVVTVTSTVPIFAVGTYTNRAVATATAAFTGDLTPIPGLEEVRGRARLPFRVSPVVGLRLVKTAGDAPDGRVEFVVGESQVRYNYELLNEGERPLASLVVSDSVYGVVGELPGPLYFDQSTNVVLVAKVAATVTNQAVATAVVLDSDLTEAEDFEPAIDTDDAVVYVGPAGLELIKLPGDAQRGETLFLDGPGEVTFRYLVVNIGAHTLDAIDVVDDQLGLVGELGLLRPGQTNEITATAIVTNTVTNLAIATGVPVKIGGQPIPGLIPVEDTDRARVDVDAVTGLELVKLAADAADGTRAVVTLGRPYTYRFRIHNTGETWLSDLALTDDHLGDLAAIERLAPGRAVVFETTVVERVTGVITNVAAVAGTPSRQDGTPIEFLEPVDAEDDAVVLITPAGLELIKTAGLADDGQTEYLPSPRHVAYTYQLLNIGQTHLRIATFTDDQLGEFELPPELMPPGSTQTVIRSTWVDATVTNTARVEAVAVNADDEPISGIPEVIAEDTADVMVGATPRVRLRKSVQGFGDQTVALVEPGDEVRYVYRIENRGDTPLVQLGVEDDRLGTIARDLVLLPDSVLSLTSAPVRVTATITNVAVATARVGYPDGDLADPALWPDAVHHQDDAVVSTRPGRVDIVKTAGRAADGEPEVLRAPDLVVYHYRVRNTGQSYIIDINVEDDRLGLISRVAGPLAPGAELTFDAVESIAASVTNTVSVTAQPADALGRPLPGQPRVSDTDDAVVLIAPRVALELRKTVAGFGDGEVAVVPANQPVTYHYALRNDGDTFLGMVVVTDDRLGAVGTVDLLAPGGELLLEASGIVTESVTNVATAVATPVYAGGAPIPGFESVTAQDDAVARVNPASVQVVKTAGAAADGETEFVFGNGLVTYRYRVINTGRAPLIDVRLADDRLGPIGDAFAGPLQPGAEIVRERQALIATDVTNIATVTAIPADASGAPDPDLAPVSDTDDAVVDVTPAAALRVVKTAGEAADGEVWTVEPGTPVAFTIAVENSGETHLSQVRVVDPALGGAWELLDGGTLAPGETVSASTTVVVTAALTNRAEAAAVASYRDGRPLPGFEPVAGSDDAVVRLHPGRVSVVKTAGRAADGETEFLPGPGVVTYHYAVRNQGTTHLVDIELTDDQLGRVGALAGPLPPGGVWQASLAALVLGDVRNTARATALAADPLGNPLPGLPPLAAQDDATVVVAPAVGVTLIKTAGDQAPGAALQVLPGTRVLYRLDVRNDGETYLANVQVVDQTLGWTQTLELLPPGGQFLLQTSIVVNASLTNEASVRALPSYSDGRRIPGLSIARADAQAQVRVVEAGLSLAKTAGAAANGQIEWARPGTSVAYRYRVVNTGTTRLANVRLDDDILGPIGERALLMPGEVFEEARDALVLGSITNFATVVALAVDEAGAPIPGIDPIEALDDAVVRVDLRPGITVTKSAGGVPPGRVLVIDPGAEVEFAYRVRNMGTVDLAEVRLEDDVLGAVGIVPHLAPGEARTVQARQRVFVTTTNEVVATGLAAYPDGRPVPGADPAEATARAVVVVNPAAVELVKTAGGAPDGQAAYAMAGPRVPFRFEVRNSGSLPLTDVVVQDRLLGRIAQFDELLLPGGERAFEISALVFGDVTNRASVVAWPADDDGARLPGLDAVRDEDEAVVWVGVVPELELVKTAQGAADGEALELPAPGGSVRYLYRVRNLGRSWLGPITVDDDRLGEIGRIERLAPGEEQVLDRSATVTETTTNFALARAVVSYGDGTPVAGAAAVEADDDATVVVAMASGRILRIAAQIVGTEGDQARIRVELEWEAVAGANAYKVERSLALPPVWEAVATTAETVLVFDDLIPEGTDAVYYRVLAQ